MVNKYHTHETEQGTLVKCYHNTKSMLLSVNFWVATVVSFPLEHALYEHVWPFVYVTKWLGL